MQNPMEKNHWLFVEGTQGDANFRVDLHKYVTWNRAHAQRAAPAVGGGEDRCLSLLPAKLS